MEPTYALTSCNCFSVRQAARHVTKLYERHFADAKLTSAQFSILGALGEGGPMTMAHLANVLVMERTALLRAMKPLQREHLLKSTSSSEDPRQLVFSLSPGGEHRLKQALLLWNNAQQEFEAEVGTREAARLRESLLALSKST